MIQNRKQYQVTNSQMSKLKAGLKMAEGSKGKMDPRLQKAMVAGLQSQIGDLKKELEEFEALEKSRSIGIESVDELSALLTKGRIARGYTQKELAEKMQLSPQQIQRYEATGYRAASFARIQKTIRVLGLDFRAQVVLK
jgi:HTH-type transcriptional regulator/antitoxin HigA